MNEIKKSKCDMCKDAGITCAHWPGGCAGDDIVDSIGTYELAARDAEWQARVDTLMEDNVRSEEQVKKQFATAVSFKARAEKAEAQVEKLDAEVRRLRAMLEPTPDARELVKHLLGVDPEMYTKDSPMYTKVLQQQNEAAQLIAVHDARLLDEAAERGVQWLIEQTSHIDPALAATNSGKWLVKLREKQTASLRAAITKAEEEV